MAKVIKFSQEVCPKCDVLEQVLEGLELSPNETVMLTDDNKEELVAKYDIMGTPLMIAFDDEGNELARTSAYNQAGQIMDFFETVQ